MFFCTRLHLNLCQVQQRVGDQRLGGLRGTPRLRPPLPAHLDASGASCGGGKQHAAADGGGWEMGILRWWHVAQLDPVSTWRNIYIYIYLFIYTYMYIYICLYLRLYLCLYLCLYLHICMYWVDKFGKGMRMGNHPKICWFLMWEWS